MKNSKAVYLHISKKTNEVIYVGAGDQKTRPYDFYQRSLEHKAHIEQYGVTVEVVQDNLSIEQAIKLESELIEKYSDNTLFNVKGGGGGMTSLSNETRSKISETRRIKKQLNPNYGKSKKLSDYVDSLKNLTDEQIKEIIVRQTATLIQGSIQALDLDAMLAEQYGVEASTVTALRTRKGRFSSYPQTLTRYKISKAWGWRLLEEGETEFKNRAKRFSTKRKMTRI